MSQKIIDHISREFINLKKSDWLQLAADCIELTKLSDDNGSLNHAKLALQFESDWEKEKEEKNYLFSWKETGEKKKESSNEN